MSFSINTNVASLQAQNYLAVNQTFQDKTINEVTSGLRIVNSGDDAAGLAIANGYRSDEAVLTQGIQNANNGVSTLQIMDGGMSNISQLLDRARTLATQSASGTFTGSRTVLNDEYQSVLSEIDRQATSIGLNQGGTFASNLSVFIGGGKGTNAAGVISNGTVSVDLSNATVDTQSLGLKGFSAGYQPTVTNGVAAADSGFYDLSAGGANSVSSLITNNNLTDATPGAAVGFTSFTLTGPGFGGSAAVNSAVKVTVNLASVGDAASLATAINAGIASAVAGGAADDQALGAANIQASIHTGSDGHEQLVFTSPNTAFSVAGNDLTANALMGNLTTVSGAGVDNTNGGATTGVFGQAVGTGADFVANGTQQQSLNFATMAATDAQTITITANGSNGAAQTIGIALSGATTTTIATAVQNVNDALQADTQDPALQGIVATANAAGTAITFSSNAASTFSISVGPDAAAGTVDALGFAVPVSGFATSAVVGVGATSSIATELGAQTAVSALAVSVATLGSAQAAVGRGENQFTYATNLAQSELTNETAAESGIRDADLAAEAANLTKAQILLQAGVAALSQANAAPQNILALLKA
jgi:flagellin